MRETRVVAVVLTWNNVDDTRECVAGIERMSPGCDEILIVDNGSRPEIAAELRTAIAKHRIVALERNQGYTGGANRALKEALDSGADWVLFLANDTVPAPELLGQLLVAGAALPGVGLVGPRVMEYDSPRTLQHGAGYLRSASGTPDVRDCTEVSECDWVTGCGFLVRADALRRMPGPRGFDEEFFCYWEDVDFSRRIAAAGYRVAYQPAAVLYHKESRSRSEANGDRRRASRLFYMARNRFLFARRHLRVGPRALSFVHQLLVEMPRVLGSSVRRHRGANRAELRLILRAYRDGLRGRRGRARYDGLY